MGLRPRATASACQTTEVKHLDIMRRSFVRNQQLSPSSRGSLGRYKLLMCRYLSQGPIFVKD